VQTSSATELANGQDFFIFPRSGRFRLPRSQH
jgi:hypothetical protein